MKERQARQAQCAIFVHGEKTFTLEYVLAFGCFVGMFVGAVQRQMVPVWMRGLLPLADPAKA